MNQSSSFFKYDSNASSRGRPPDAIFPTDTIGSESPLTAKFLQVFPATRVAWRTSQLQDAGFGGRAIQCLVANGVLLRIHYGTYFRRSTWDKLPSVAQERTKITMHHFGTLNRSATGSIYSHSSAARLHGLHLWQADDLIHITQTTKPSSSGCDDGTRLHKSALPSGDITQIGELHVTTLERTVVDCCLTMSYKQSLIITDNALHRGASMHLLQEMASRLPRHRGVRNLRKVLAHADGLSESPGETLTRDLLRELNIERPQLQQWIVTRQGNYRADFARPEKRVVLEFDGRTKYFNYRPTDEAVFLERKREVALVEAGWTVLRIEWKDLFNEESFRTRVLAALNR